MSVHLAPGRNVLGNALAACAYDPLTGFARDGCCRHVAGDRGQHVVCARMTADFLAFSMTRGNDLSTPRPEYRFRGLQPGQRWCLCLARWIEAWQAGVAPPVVLEATDESVLQHVPLDVLQAHAWTPPGANADDVTG